MSCASLCRGVDQSSSCPDGFPCHIHRRHSTGVHRESPRACAVTLCQAVVGRRHARARGARAHVILFFKLTYYSLLYLF
jgi:hypothetical protein